MDNLSTYGKKLEELPFILQYNKRDLKNISTIEELDKALNFLHVPSYEAVAPAGKGVTETLVAISRRVFSNLRQTLLMPGEMAAHEDLGELADARIQRTFTGAEAETLEEISEVEEIGEAPPPAGVAEKREVSPLPEVELEPTTLREPDAPRASPAPFAELHEIEVEPPAPAAPPVRPPSPTPAPAPVVSVTAEEGGLTFLKFESPFVSPEGHAVLPALFLDGAGNPVRLRIRISMEGEQP